MLYKKRGYDDIFSYRRNMGGKNQTFTLLELNWTRYLELHIGEAEYNSSVWFQASELHKGKLLIMS